MILNSIKNLKASKIDFVINGIFAIFSSWIILGATPYLRIGGLYVQVETQILYLHIICLLMVIYKICTNLFLKTKLGNIETNNPLTILPLSIGILSFFASMLDNSFYKYLLGSPQIGQGTLWYFNLYIMISVFSIFLINKKARILIFINMILLTTVATVFTIKPYFLGLNISFYNFTDYLCFYGVICFIIFTTIVRNKVLLLIGYGILGLYLIPLNNKSAYLVWVLTLIAGAFYFLINQLKYNYIIKIKKILYSNLALTGYVFAASCLIVLSSKIFWSNEFGLPEEITKSPISSLVVRGKIAETSLLSLIDLKSFFLGNGWGEVPVILLANMSVWHFDQLTLGYALHFHTHNELAEHFVSLGILGFLLYIILIFYIFKFSDDKKIFIKLSWFFFFMLGCFWFLFSGTLPLFAIAIACLAYNFSNCNINNSFYKNLIYFKKKSDLLIHSFILVLLVLGIRASYSNIGMHARMNSNELIDYIDRNQGNIEECQNYFYDFDRGGYMLPPMINNLTTYVLNIEKENLNKNSAKTLKFLFCIAHDLMASDKANLDLIATLISTENRIYFSERENLKELLYSKDDIVSWKQKIDRLSELAPKRGDLLIPTLAYFMESGNSKEVIKMCESITVIGIEAYCELFFAYDMLEKNKLSKKQLTIALDHLKKAVEKGILHERVYGWWREFRVFNRDIHGFNKDGIPLSPDLLFHVSHEETYKILDILEDYRNGKIN